MNEPGQSPDPSEDPRHRYERHRSDGAAAIELGALGDALEHLERALDCAREIGDRELMDRAVCNRAAVQVSLGDTERPIPRLRQILMATECDENAFLAAYTIARAYELRKEHKKGLFYVRIATERAERLDRTEYRAWCRNQKANLQVADSLFEDALASYQEARRLSSKRSEELTIDVNMGYCRVVLGDIGPGIELLERTLDAARRESHSRLEMIANLDLCFAHLELGDLSVAQQYGQAGLGLAEESGDVDWVKNGLYLMGESMVLDGRLQEGRAYFEQLQERYYPEQQFVANFLTCVDVRQVINLRA